MEKNESKLVGIPTKISEWNIDVLNNLVKTKKIENDDFDFKGDYKDLSKHICAFANCSFGQMVLGMDPSKDNEGRTIGIVKNGFPESESDLIRNEVIYGFWYFVMASIFLSRSRTSSGRDADKAQLNLVPSICPFCLYFVRFWNGIMFDPYCRRKVGASLL